MNLRMILCALLVVAGSLPAHAHGGAGDHSHDAPNLNVPAAVSATGAHSLSGHGSQFDLTIVYPPFHAGDTVLLDVYLADWQTNEPIYDATFDLTMTGPNSRATLPVESTDEPGRYRTRIEHTDDAEHSFLADINAGDEFDLISMSGFSPGHGSEEIADDASAIHLRDFGLYIVAAVAVVAGLIGFALGSMRRAKRSPDHEVLPEEAQ